MKQENTKSRVHISILLLLWISFQVRTAETQEAVTFEDAFNAYLRTEYATAESLLRPLVDQGVPEAMSLLGFMQVEGLVEADPEPHLERAAELGDPEAQFQVGARLVLEPQSFDEGLGHLVRASIQGHIDASFILGMTFMRQQAPIDKFTYWFDDAIAGGLRNAWGGKMIAKHFRGDELDPSEIDEFAEHSFDGTQESYLAIGFREYDIAETELDRERALMWLWLGSYPDVPLPSSITTQLDRHRDEIVPLGDNWLASNSTTPGTPLAEVSAWCHETQMGLQLTECLRRSAADHLVCRPPFFPNLIENFGESPAYADCRSHRF